MAGGGALTTQRRWSTFALVAFIALVVNFPALHSRHLAQQLDSRGVDVVAEVTDTRAVGDDFLVEFTVPAEGARAKFEGAVVDVDQRTYDEADQTGFIPVTVLPDNGGVFEAAGQQHSRVGLVVTLLADLFLLAVLVLAWRFRTDTEEE